MANLPFKILLVIAVVLLGALAFVIFPWYVALVLAALVVIMAVIAYRRDY